LDAKAGSCAEKQRAESAFMRPFHSHFVLFLADFAARKKQLTVREFFFLFPSPAINHQTARRLRIVSH
jgi:hypothetical protein